MEWFTVVLLCLWTFAIGVFVGVVLENGLARRERSRK